VTGDILRLLLLLLQLGFVALLYLVLLRFAASLLKDLRSAEEAQVASRSGIGRLSVLESPEDEPQAGSTIALGPINSIGRNVNNTIYVEDDFVSTNHAMLTFRGRSLVHRGPGQHERDVRQRPSHRPTRGAQLRRRAHRRARPDAARPVMRR
jgi:hypothetical protein